MAYLELHGLGKGFRHSHGRARDQVLAELSLDVERGETVAVFGPSGSGKTVLLRLIAGVLEPDRGRVTIAGGDVTALPPERRDVGMAFQTFALYPHLSAFENIASPLRARRLNRAEIEQRVGRTAELLRITHVLGHRPAQLSNGQKQRTALARALVGAPGVLLLDDPLRNVDAKLRYEMRLELPRVLREFESTALYVTQDYREAMALGDRIGVLGGGRFRQLDTPRRIYRRPADLEVAKLFGDPPMNLFRVKPERAADGAISVVVGGSRLSMPMSMSMSTTDGGGAIDPAAAAGRDCLLGVRPEDITLHAERDRIPARDGALALELETVTPLNLRNVMLLKTEDGSELLASTAEGEPVVAGGGMARDYSHSRQHRRLWGHINWRRAVLFDRDGRAFGAPAAEGR